MESVEDGGFAQTKEQWIFGDNLDWMDVQTWTLEVLRQKAEDTLAHEYNREWKWDEDILNGR